MGGIDAQVSRRFPHGITSDVHRVHEVSLRFFSRSLEKKITRCFSDGEKRSDVSSLVVLSLWAKKRESQKKPRLKREKNPLSEGTEATSNPDLCFLSGNAAKGVESQWFCCALARSVGKTKESLLCFSPEGTPKAIWTSLYPCRKKILDINI